MINTITIGFLFLNFLEVMTANFEISISQSTLYSQKRNVNAISTNTTFIVNCKILYAQYCSIELNQTQTRSAEIALLFLEGQAPFLDQKEDLIYDGMDYDSYVQKKRNHFILIPSSNDKVYFTVLTNVPISFDIYLRGSQTKLCPNDCQGNGKCLEGVCKCDKGFIARDCSLKALQLEEDQNISVNGSHDPNFYCYYEKYGTQDLRLEISTKDDFNETLAYILIPDLVYLPTNNFFNDAARITKYSPLIREIDQRSSRNQDNYDSIPDRLIILLQGGQFNIKLESISEDNKGDQMKTIIIIICSVAGSLLICFCIFLIRRARQKRSSEKQSPEDYEMREKQFTYGRSSIKKEDEFVTMDNQIQSNELQDNCAICLDPLSNKQPIKYTPCKHIFHAKCIEKWLQKNQFCPFCRFDLKIDNLTQQKQLQIKIPVTNQIRIIRRNN